MPGRAERTVADRTPVLGRDCRRYEEQLRWRSTTRSGSTSRRRGLAGPARPRAHRAVPPGRGAARDRGDEHRGVLEVDGRRDHRAVPRARRGSSPPTTTTHTAILVGDRARRRDGEGNASATIELTLFADGDGTRVDVDTDLSVTGKVAQFGHDVIARTSAKLLAQFVENLGRDVARLRTPTTTPTSGPDRDRIRGRGRAGEELEAEAGDVRRARRRGGGRRGRARRRAVRQRRRGAPGRPTDGRRRSSCSRPGGTPLAAPAGPDRRPSWPRRSSSPAGSLRRRKR